MAMIVTTGSTMMCSFGVAPSTFVALGPTTMAGGTPAGTIMDNAPMANIPPFVMCMSLSNPTVAAATAAALGVLTPMPCVPAIPAPWTPPSPTVMIGKKPALNNNAICNCAYGGVIKFIAPVCMTVMIP